MMVRMVRVALVPTVCFIGSRRVYFDFMQSARHIVHRDCLPFATRFIENLLYQEIFRNYFIMNIRKHVKSHVLQSNILKIWWQIAPLALTDCKLLKMM